CISKWCVSVNTLKASCVCVCVCWGAFCVGCCSPGCVERRDSRNGTLFRLLKAPSGNSVQVTVSIKGHLSTFFSSLHLTAHKWCLPQQTRACAHTMFLD